MTEPQLKQPRAAFYARVSTEEQREGQTIESQVAELERFASERNWTVVRIYKDEAWSGSILARPALDRLRDDATKGIFDTVIVNDVDRLARDVAHLGIIKRDFERKQIQLVFRKLPGESSPTYNLMVNILGSFAEFERELIIDRTRRGRRHKVEVRKQYVGCIAPYGYHYETKSATGGNDARIEIVHDEARVVRQIYQWAAAGLSMGNITARLIDMHVPTRTGKLIWGIAVVQRILRNEAYAGIWSYGKRESCEPQAPRNKNVYRRKTKTSRRTKPKAQWLRITLPDSLIIIDRSFWCKVQDRIDRNPKFSTRNAHAFYMLQGLLRCGHCGAAYSGTFSTYNGTIYYYYRCWKKNCSKSRWTRRDVLDSAIWSALQSALLDPKHFAKRIAESSAELSQEEATKSTADKDPERSRQEAESRIFQQYRAGNLSPRQLADQLEALKAPRAALPQLAENGGSEPRLDQWKIERPLQETCRRFAAWLQDASPEKRREILRRLVVEAIVENDRVTIHAKVSDDSDSNAIDEKIAPLGVDLSPSRRYTCNTTMVEFELIAPLPPPAPNTKRSLKERYQLEALSR